MLFALNFKASAQNKLSDYKKEMADLFSYNLKKLQYPEYNHNTPNNNENISVAPFILKMPEVFSKYSSKPIPSNLKLNDTLWIGETPGDSVIISGQWSWNGPIIVIGEGKLRFNNANATIMGDITVWGEDAEVTGDMSTIYFPQQYFYQRTLVAAGGGKIIFRNCHLDFSGFSHSMAAVDSAYIGLFDVTKNGWATVGLYGKPTFEINGIDQAGEFVITDSCNLNFRNANTVLLWHQIPSSGIINFSFPSPGIVDHYEFNNTLPGVTGIKYNITADTCSDVMWALMPSTGSDVTLNNSDIKLIGLWFRGNDTITVSGLVNNSSYNSFTANLSDRNLTLNNSDVETWSLYTFDKSRIVVSGCILGEIGAMGSSSVSGNSFCVDGSGGYLWGTDTTIVIAASTTATTHVRSEGHSIVVFAGGAETQGEPAALDNSILIIAQSIIPQDPVMYENSCAWYANIEQPANGNVNSNIAITGSAWIDKTLSSPLMDFGKYKMMWMKQNDTIWQSITGNIFNEVRHDTLAVWNTQGLTEGNYILKLSVTDNTVDSNVVEAVKMVHLYSLIFDNEEINNDSELNIYPNPCNNTLNININNFIQIKNSTDYEIYDFTGKITDISGKISTNNYSVNVDKLQPGLYFIKINNRIMKFSIVR